MMMKNMSPDQMVKASQQAQQQMASMSKEDLDKAMEEMNKQGKWWWFVFIVVMFCYCDKKYLKTTINTHLNRSKWIAQSMKYGVFVSSSIPLSPLYRSMALTHAEKIKVRYISIFHPRGVSFRIRIELCSFRNTIRYEIFHSIVKLKVPLFKNCSHYL